MHRLIEERAASAPTAVAVRFRDESLTYGALNRRANQLARYLAASNIGRGRYVVVCVEPALDVVVALLAILKAGAVYVPLDPAYPAARIRTILEETRPDLVVTQSHLIERLALQGEPTLAIDTAAPLLSGFSTDNRHLGICPEDTAYVYYTSGTTGTPKGVMASYANLSTYIQAAQKRYRFTSRDVMPAIARFSFSISMFELLFPLAAGGSVVILEREHILDFARMSRTMSEVTFVHAGPSLLKNLLSYIKRNHAKFEAFSKVRHASTGGDMVAPDMLEALREVFLNAEVFVIYGCSEISCMGCTYPVPRVGPLARTYVGRPFDNMIVKVLSPSLDPVPVGTEGEIHFAGPGVVVGYLNRPDLTAERFVKIDGRRFYRTGDVGRISAEGWLEILGRSDFQVKIRGMRVELGEVEHHLSHAPGVRDGVVMAKEINEATVLVAYVVMDDDSRDGDEGRGGSRMSAVRRHMADRLPDYMLPSEYVQLAALPLNFNMKVDRRALPDPRVDREPITNAAARVRGGEPQTPTERYLASLWKKLLRVDEIGLCDNFFELGGDSLLALKLILEVDRELGVLLEGMDVLRESLQVLAAICDRLRGITVSAPRHSVSEAPAAPAVELFHFGRDGSLYGVLHRARGPQPSGGRSALICSPVGHEYLRSHFVLQRLAQQLASSGVSVLRFDYYGCRDSLGESIEATCCRWQHDIADAYSELERRTNAAQIAAIGVRLGATLLCNLIAELDLVNVVLWDPICQGDAYYDEIVEGHRQYVRGLERPRFWRSRAHPTRGMELLGSTYSETALLELKALVIAQPATRLDVPIKWLATSRPAHQKGWFEAIRSDTERCRIEAMDFDCGWQDMACLEDILPDVGISSKLAEMVLQRP